MTHFLARLVDRARGTVSRVKPVITPRFASIRPTDAESKDELSEAQDRETTAKFVLAPAADVGDENELRKTQDGDTLASKESKPARRPGKTIESKQPLRSAKPGETRTVEIIRESLLVPQVHQEMHDALITHAPLELETNAQDVRTTPTDKTREPRQQPRRATPHPSQVRPSHRLPAERKNGRAPDGVRDQAPVVRVTIGRIEVRAVHQSAPVPKPAKPALPKLSLDDYLRGGRR
jgi:hypothetical protein